MLIYILISILFIIDIIIIIDFIVFLKQTKYNVTKAKQSIELTDAILSGLIQKVSKYKQETEQKFQETSSNFYTRHNALDNLMHNDLKKKVIN